MWHTALFLDIIHLLSYVCFECVFESDCSKQETPLHLACKSGKLEMVALLLSWKAAPGVCLPDGRNALDVAIDNFHEDCALKLVEHDTWKDSLRNATKPENSSEKTQGWIEYFFIFHFVLFV